MALVRLGLGTSQAEMKQCPFTLQDPSQACLTPGTRLNLAQEKSSRTQVETQYIVACQAHTALVKIGLVHLCTD